jgi:hypothetical protein
MMKEGQWCAGPLRMTRRQVLQAGSIGLLGLSLPRMLRADATRVKDGPVPSADSCILVFLNGGPSHLDMWDMKPDAPAEIRGPFKSVATSVPSVRLSEHLPRLAKLMHHAALVRSVHHSVDNSHAAAVYAGMTGHDRGERGGGAKPTDNPAIGSVVGMYRPPRTPIVPYVSMPYITAEGRGGPPQPGFFGGLLGRTRDTLFVLRDPNAHDFAMPELSLTGDMNASRLDHRKRLVEQLASGGRMSPDNRFRNDRPTQEMSGFQGKAFDLLTSAVTQRAFQLDREPLPVRESYGRNIYGQSTLLARRLIEAGTRVACISWAPDANATWDTHGNNFNSLKGTLLPQLDAAVSSLLTDLSVRRMLGRTLVAVMGEFGRSPKVNPAAGRDHWNFCYSLMLAGGGIKGGVVHGSSDKIGARPSNCPVGPADVIATIYHCLGIRADFEVHDRLGRPFQLVPAGTPIRELLV